MTRGHERGLEPLYLSAGLRKQLELWQSAVVLDVYSSHLITAFVS